MKVRTDDSGCTAEQRALIVEDQRASEHKVNAGVQVRTRAGIDGSVDFHYVSPQTWAEQVVNLSAQGLVYQPFHLDACALVNARVGYRFLQNHLEPSAVVFNALGVEHREHPFGQVVGRRGMGFLTYRF